MTHRFPSTANQPEAYHVEQETYRARRATVDDLPSLHGLWQKAGLPWDQLERYVTEFIVIPDDSGLLVGAIGLQVEGDQALVHSEAFFDCEIADAARQALWQRIQIIARNQGVYRLWTLEDAPFWTTTLVRASEAEAASLRAPFADPTAVWWTHQLLDPVRAQALLDERLALWSAQRQADSTELAEGIQRIRRISYGIAGAVALSMCLLVLYVLIRRPDALQQLLRGLGSQ